MTRLDSYTRSRTVPRVRERQRQFDEVDYFNTDYDSWANEVDFFDPPSRLPQVTRVRFSNTGRTHANNCCAFCPVPLGVGISGTGLNGMELQFTLAGHRPGIWYDVLRTRRNSLWERRAGGWTLLDSAAMGTWDDRTNQDECLSPRGNSIFVIDTPGFPDLSHPSLRRPGATDLVLRASFAEWVNAKSSREGINWKTISPGPYTFWHTINWLTRNAAGQWVLDRARSRIARGSLSAAVINAPPT